MKISFSQSIKNRGKGDLLVIPYWEGPEEASSLKSFIDISSFLDLEDFKGKNGEASLLYVHGKEEPRCLLLGLGSKQSAATESLRRATASAVQMARGKKLRNIHFLFPDKGPLSAEESVRGICEGFYLANYAFTKLKGESAKEDDLVLVESVVLFGVDEEAQNQIEGWQKIASSVYCARDWVNDNSDAMDPSRLAKEALAMDGKGLHVTVFDKKWLIKEGMGLILAVGRGGRADPCLIQASYQGNPHSKELIVLVGKGITYDTGGLCLKPPDNMASMKCDMAGAAVVLQTVRSVASLGLKVNVTALAPVAENSIGPDSYRQGDVYRSYSGKTVEILNTDAEGRLILADALSYAVKNLRPSFLIDVATLTGSMIVALGEEVSGCFSNDDGLADRLLAAAQRTGESLWRMPLYDYKDALHSEIADLANVGSGRDAGAVKAALFLQEFAGGLPWAHLDIAGPAYLSKPKFYYPTRGTGWGVRLLVDFLQHRKTK